MPYRVQNTRGLGIIYIVLFTISKVWYIVDNMPKKEDKKYIPPIPHPKRKQRWEYDFDGGYERDGEEDKLALEEWRVQHDPNHQVKLVLYFSADGDLWRPPKDRYLSPFNKNEGLYKLFHYLVSNQEAGFIKTKKITDDITKTEDYVRDAVRTINRKTHNLLTGFGEKEKLIEGRRISGYRINPKLQIVDD